MPLVLPTPQGLPTYPGQAVEDPTDFQALGLLALGTGTVSGCTVSAQTVPNNTVQVASGSGCSGWIEFSVSSVSSLTVTSLPPSSDRRDIVVCNSSGSVTIVAGTPCGTTNWTPGSTGLPPIKPTIPGSDIVLAEIYIPGGTTTITNGMIVDKTSLLSIVGGAYSPLLAAYLEGSPIGLNTGQQLSLQVGTINVVNYSVSGLTTVGITQTPQVLANGQLSSTSVTSVYSPSSGSTTVTSINLFNTSGSSVTLKVFLVGTVSTDQVYAASIAPGGSVQYGGGVWSSYSSVGLLQTGTVSSVSNSDGTATVSPTTGSVVVSRPAITGDVTIPIGSNVAVVTGLSGVSVPTGPSAGQAVVTTSGSTAVWESIPTSVFGRTGAVVASSGDYVASQITFAADRSSGSTQVFTAAIAVPDLVISGLTGAGNTVRWVGGTTGGAPVTGTFTTGDGIIDETGLIWICTSGGSPGTWFSVGSSPINVEQGGSYNGTTYTLVLADGMSEILASNSSAQTFTVPPSSSVAFPVGVVVNFTQIGSGKLTLAQGAGVTIDSSGGLLGCRVQFSTISLLKIGTNLWQLAGDTG